MSILGESMQLIHELYYETAYTTGQSDYFVAVLNQHYSLAVIVRFVLIA